MLETGADEDVVSHWAAETRRPWEKSNFANLWVKEQKAGPDPHQAFLERGLEPKCQGNCESACKKSCVLPFDIRGFFFPRQFCFKEWEVWKSGRLDQPDSRRA
jgi:hypothetical protein